MSSMVFIHGAKELSAKLDIMASSMYDFGDVFEDAGAYWRDQVDMQFKLRGALPGVRGPWIPLAEATVAKKRNSAPLIDSGRMRTSYSTPSAPYNVSRVSLKKATFGSGYRARNNVGRLKPVALFHQLGTEPKNSSNGMPARPIVLGNKLLDQHLVDSFSRHMFRGWDL